jgi:hypothetical protein
MYKISMKFSLVYTRFTPAGQQSLLLPMWTLDFGQFDTTLVF